MTATLEPPQLAPATQWGRFDGQLKPFVRDETGAITTLTWAAMPGSQEGFLKCGVSEVCYAGTRGPGKSLSDSTRILTDSGWKTVGEVTYEDRLVAPDGTLTEIEGIFPHDDLELVKVTFSDGSSVVVDPEHRWSIRRSKDGKRADWKVKTTAQIAGYIEKNKGKTRSANNRCFIPLISRPAPGPLWTGADPYIVGLMLGDGTTSGSYATIYTVEPEIVEYLRDAGWKIYNYDSQNTQMCQWTGRAQSDELKDTVGRATAKDKRVSEELLMSDPATRRALLQGLVDTDGHVDKDGRVEFTSSSKQLADDVVYLARSLGGQATSKFTMKHGRYDKDEQGHEMYRVRIRHCNNFCPVRLPRHVARIKKMKGNYRRIESVEPAGRGPATCFRVAHESHLFVVQDFIVTHNTDALLMSFAQHIGKWGKDWRGIIFRRTYPELEDIIGKADKWFTEIFPEATYNKGKHFWEWPGGERLYFGHMRVPGDYNKYHGHNYPFIGWEELTTWPSKDCFVVMLSTNRTTNPNVPKMVRATTNPHGVGHNWVKARYKLPVKAGEKFGEICGGDIMLNEKGRPILDNQGKEMHQPQRIAIHGDIDENFLLLDADPGYKATIAASASSPSQLKAWLHGSWDVVAGGMFDDLWDSQVHIVEPFKVPKSWRFDRSFDWGSSKPASVGFWAESDGTDYIDAAGFRVSTVRGDLFRVHEWYMCKKGEENKGLMLTDREIANGCKDLMLQHPVLMNRHVYPGPADTSIWDTTNGSSIAKAMSNMGVRWTKADKSSGSRILGWQRIRNRLQASLKKEGLPREHPGLFVFDTCDAFIRTVPVLPRDDKNTDDVDTESEDHIADELRYKIYSRTGKMINKKIRGR